MVASPEEKAARFKKWYYENRDYQRLRAKKWYEANKGTIDREAKREYLKAYHQANKHKRKKPTPEMLRERRRMARERYATDPEYRARARRQSRESSKRRSKAQRLAESHGIPLETFQMFLEKQQGVCAICSNQGTTERFKHLSVDHNHVTGEIRGLLCHKCNMGIGQFQDNPELLQKAIAYLTNSSSGVISTASKTTSRENSKNGVSRLPLFMAPSVMTRRNNDC